MVTQKADDLFSYHRHAVRRVQTFPPGLCGCVSDAEAARIIVALLLLRAESRPNILGRLEDGNVTITIFWVQGVAIVLIVEKVKE